MGEIVNLRRARKAAARAADERRADANRVAHGTPPALRRQAEAERSLDARRLEGHRLLRDAVPPHED